MNSKRKKILLGMSGGVDSSVAALLLKQDGHHVVGYTMVVRDEDAGRGGSKDVNDARKVAELLGIQHHVFDLRREFKTRVVDYFVSSYLAGQTPNPCSICNRHIKFGLMFDKACELDFDLIATGHYARLRPDNHHVLLQEARDAKKSQAYFLALVNKDAFQRCFFPIGNLTKNAVRKIAQRADLPVHLREESQEVCFIPNDDYAAFIKNIAPKRVTEGPILDTSGKPIGRHKGFIHYTIGQRRGLGASFGSPRYVVRIDPKQNTIVLGSKNDLLQKNFYVHNINWLSPDIPDKPLRANVRIRYRSAPEPATLYPEQNRLRIHLDETQPAITPGQVAVFNRGDIVLGGGLIAPT